MVVVMVYVCFAPFGLTLFALIDGHTYSSLNLKIFKENGVYLVCNIKLNLTWVMQ